MLKLLISLEVRMNSYEKAVFLDFVLNNLNNLNVHSKIAGGKILQLGYHKNHPITYVSNSAVSYDLSNADDDGFAAQKLALQHHVPHVLSGTLSPKNVGLFKIHIDDEGAGYGVREKSLANMTNPQPHVFELFCYEPTDFGVSTSQGQKLQLVFNKSNGSVWTLNDMLSASAVAKPPGLKI